MNGSVTMVSALRIVSVVDPDYNAKMEVMKLDALMVIYRRSTRLIAVLCMYM